jgi:hypothetical protein
VGDCWVSHQSVRFLGGDWQHPAQGHGRAGRKAEHKVERVADKALCPVNINALYTQTEREIEAHISAGIGLSGSDAQRSIPAAMRCACRSPLSTWSARFAHGLIVTCHIEKKKPAITQHMPHTAQRSAAQHNAARDSHLSGRTTWQVTSTTTIGFSGLSSE